MDFDISGRVALVTGASRGLGLASALALAAEGCAVAVSARGEEGVAAAVAQIEAVGGRALGVVADMSLPAGPARAVAATEAGLGPVDVLVANAGGPPPGPFTEMDDPSWELALAQNLMGTVRLIRAALPGMRARGWGRIVTITSRSAREAIDGLVLSNATRSGVAGVVRTLAREVAADGVTVNNVMPGSILTDRLRAIHGSDEAIERRGRAIPAGRVGRPEELGALVAFLASRQASYITGASVLVDGGESHVIA